MATNILMPALSPTMEEGKLSKWLVKEGDTVKSGDILAEIETDKATMEFEAVDEGKIGRIIVPEGTEGVKVNAPIATLLSDGEKAGDVDIPAAMKDIKAAVKAEAPAPVPPIQYAAGSKNGASNPLAPGGGEGKGEGAKPAAAPAGDGKRIFASPLARRIAAAKGIDISALSGSGPRGAHRQVRCRERQTRRGQTCRGPGGCARRRRRIGLDAAARRQAVLQAGGLYRNAA